MAYADIAAVQAKIPQFPLTSSSKPTQADAETFLRDAEAEVDATLSNMGYVVPITGDNSRAIVRGLVVALTIVHIMQARAAGVGGDAAHTTAVNAQKWYDDRLKKLAGDDPLELTDAQRNDDQRAKPQFTINGLLLDDDGEDIEPRFTMDQAF